MAVHLLASVPYILKMPTHASRSPDLALLIRQLLPRNPFKCVGDSAICGNGDPPRRVFITEGLPTDKYIWDIYSCEGAVEAISGA